MLSNGVGVVMICHRGPSPMFDELDRLFEVVKLNPHDDAALLTYADDLQKAGQESDATQIREHVSRYPNPAAEPPRGLSSHDRRVWFARAETAHRERKLLVNSLRRNCILRRPSRIDMP